MITAAEAMARAIDAADRGLFEHGRLWLDIARELREEAVSRRAWSAFEPKVPPVPDKAAEIAVPVARPVFADAMSQVTETIERVRPVSMWDGTWESMPDSAHCHCGYMIVKQDGAKAYYHRQTNQQTCPVPERDANGDETFVHTFAWPEGYSRT